VVALLVARMSWENTTREPVSPCIKASHDASDENREIILDRRQLQNFCRKNFT
jgi:hypothetical protein